MNYCKKCGHELMPGARFCGSCGQVLVNEEKTIPVLPDTGLTCKHCGAKLRSGIKFCGICGKAINGTRPVSQKTDIPGPLQASLHTSKPLQVTGQGKKKSEKILKIAAALVTLGLFVVAGFYFLRTNKPAGSYSSLKDLYQDEKYDPVIIEKAAATVETIFAAADTAGLANILSPVTLVQRREFFAELMPLMPAFAADFKSRKLLYATPRFAVYGFSSAGGKFTADFCLGEDGNWKLMRF